MMPNFLASDFIRESASLVVASLWQGAIIAAGLAVCLRLLPRTSAEQRFTLWGAAFATIASLPLLTSIAGLYRTVTAVAETPASNFAIQHSINQPLISPLIRIDARWCLAIVAIWVTAAVFRAIDLLMHSVRLRRIWKQATPVHPEGGPIAKLAIADSRENRRSVEICTTTELQRPSVIGFLRPRILIPDWLLAHLTPDELQQIVLHECEHLRRRDDWTNLIQKICLVLFPLNPALVWIERRLCREREMACDEGVIAITGAPRAYAACLTSLAEHGLQHRAEALSLGAWHRRPELVHRVHSILRRSNVLGPIGSRSMLSALGCGLIFGSISLARCPQLVAFVQVAPTHAVTLSSENTRLNETPHLVNASYIKGKTERARRAQATASALSSDKSSSINLAEQCNEVCISEQPFLAHQAEARMGKTPLPGASATSQHAVRLKAEMPGTATAPAPSQQWLVVTAWEQVETSQQNATLRADFETPDSVSPVYSAQPGPVSGESAELGVQPAAQLPAQITVTRLILKIYPVTMIPTQSTALPIHGGWFVLQL